VRLCCYWRLLRLVPAKNLLRPVLLPALLLWQQLQRLLPPLLLLLPLLRMALQMQPQLLLHQLQAHSRCHAARPLLLLYYRQ
jgi:hypothetical protein